MCKLKLQVERDSNFIGTGLANDLSLAAQQAILGSSNYNQQQSDENLYFVDAKKIKISFRSGPQLSIKKKEVIVHYDCYKQMEIIKAEKLQRIQEK